MMSLHAASLAETHAIAAAVAASCRSGDLVVLAGQMGAGKTAFAQGFGAALGIGEPITSPTYNLVHSYDMGRLTLHHADIYRLGSQHELADLALSELLEDDGIVLVEWGDVVAHSLGDHLMVKLAHLDETGDDPGSDDTADHHPAVHDPAVHDSARVLTVACTGRTWAARWDRLTTALQGFQR